MVERNDTSSDPHRGQPIRAFSEPLQNAQAAMLMVHGRGARSKIYSPSRISLVSGGLLFLRLKRPIILGIPTVSWHLFWITNRGFHRRSLP